MTLKEILHALKTREITPEEAKRELQRINNASDIPLNPDCPENPDNKSNPELGEEKIAIIGMSGQFPMAKSVADYWNNLTKGLDCITEIPASRWLAEDYYDEDPKVPGKSYSKWMGVLEDMDKFDPLFFSISPLEAEFMDPQQRLFLENCWHCLEDAGIKPSSLSSARCGVFAGCTMSDYRFLCREDELNAYSMIGIHSSILSSRISYLLNLKGPSLAIDTACSSSLVAIAEACNSLILRNSDLALAGGVAILSTPSIHIMTSKMDVLSRGDRCFPFDNRADGYIPGEGVGVLLLKRLSDAVRDKDHIYGVISGWGVNQDGKTNGITAPSVKSQMLLEQEVYQRFGINPETISFVEAHGTGTKLGDPIEVEALIKSFRRFTKKEEYCALGSVKGNIGHLMTAAGAASVIKVLLAMQHKILPPTINFKTLNEHITLDKSPFYINTRLQPWQPSSGNRLRAAVSAFGFSGTNAHIVLEEYPAGSSQEKIWSTKGRGNRDISSVAEPVLIVLSARSKTQLTIYAEKLKNYIEIQENPELEDIGYTLQTGREELDYRLAVPADSKELLIRDLEGFINGKTDTKVITGLVTGDRSKAELFDANGAAQALLEKLILNKKLRQLGELWVKGIQINWERLYENREPQKISLPVYPFAQERYWLEKGVERTRNNRNSPKYIHPLLQENTSNLMEQRFSSVFSGSEFFFMDHQVKQRKVLPGAAYLEMVRAAVEVAAELSKGEKMIIRLKNLVWARPVVITGEPVKVHISLVPNEKNEIIYEVYSDSNEGDATIHSQGKIEICEAKQDLFERIPSLLERKWNKTLAADDCYAAFRKMGIVYGPGHRGIETLYVGDGEVLAKLALPSAVTAGAGEYMLHPSMLDSAFQATIGLILENGEGGAAMPFAIDEMEIRDRCVPSMWVVVRPGADGTGRKQQKFDLELCDDEGKVSVLVRGLSLRVIENERPVLSFHKIQDISFNDILSQVRSGELDINSADHLLSSLNTEG